MKEICTLTWTHIHIHHMNVCTHECMYAYTHTSNIKTKTRTLHTTPQHSKSHRMNRIIFHASQSAETNKKKQIKKNKKSKYKQKYTTYI